MVISEVVERLLMDIRAGRLIVSVRARIKPPPSDSQISSQPLSQRDIDGAANPASTDHAAWVYDRAKLTILCH
jgi:hypothetical protein